MFTNIAGKALKDDVARIVAVTGSGDQIAGLATMRLVGRAPLTPRHAKEGRHDAAVQKD